MTYLLLLLIVVALFNVIIFVHELGHFLAARWRGLRVDRFQIWFGKPIWKKEINGVQYGLGWIPAGGFVALPQMAPMEAVEGKNREPGALEEDKETLPPVKPLDKIIVAFAGPLFSFLLAIVSAFVVMGVGKPIDAAESTVIGHVEKDGPAYGKLLAGDEILAINGEKVDGFVGSLNSVRESIMLSEGDQLEFLVLRDGAQVTVTTEFKIPETKWWQRKALRRAGISVENRTVIGGVLEGGPAGRAGLETDDVVLSVNGEVLRSRSRFREIVEGAENKVLQLIVERDGKEKEISVTPQSPTNIEPARVMIGVGFGDGGEINTELFYPSPLQQIEESVKIMEKTLVKVASPKSDVGIQHLSGPVGIGGVMYDLLQIEDGWRRLLFFMVLFNVNLAILNMLPLPILDGGHIVLALGEFVTGRPMRGRLLEMVQAFVLFSLLALFLFITSKDVADRIGLGGGDPGPATYEWPSEQP